VAMVIVDTNNLLFKWLQMLHVVTVREMLFDARPGRRPDTTDDQCPRRVRTNKTLGRWLRISPARCRYIQPDVCWCYGAPCRSAVT
jgi:hypothetical protein